MFMDSIKFYPRFNWIYGGFDCKKIDFLSQFRLLLEEIKVLGSNYNFEELMWSNQGLNCIIIEVWWPIKDLIETIWNQDQTGKGAKIKGSNYNLFGGLDYKIAKNIQGPNQKYAFWISKRRRFLDNCWSPSSSATVSTVNERYQWSHFSNKNGRLLQLWGMFHGYYSSTCHYHVGRCTACHSLAYKSQRKTMKRKKEKERGGKTRGERQRKE